MKPTAAESAKWHRQFAVSLHDIASVTYNNEYRSTAAHHEAAAEALEALAVPGVAELLTMLAQDGACVTAGIGGEYPDDAQRAALTTLVKIGGDR